MKKRAFYNLNTVRSKTMALSKLAGGAIVLFYLLTEELPVNRNITFWIRFALLVAVIMTVDFLLGRVISEPLGRINATAKKMAKFDETARCDVDTNDELGELSQSLNAMFSDLRDVLGRLETANKRLEEEVEQERILLEQRKELTDSLSHEMKTPLGLIRAYTEGLSDETDPEKKRRYTDSILDATERMDHMIISLLDLSALESGTSRLTEERFEFVELAETVAGRLLLDTPETNYSFCYELPDENVYVFADKQRIEQVLNNLIENAKKYVRPDGEIRLHIYCEENGLRFTVFNHCDPLEEEEISRIWEKFYRGTGNKCRGSGLGLALAAQILTMYHAGYGARLLDGGIEVYFQFPTIS